MQVDPAKIAALGMQLEDIASVITTATVDAPKGSINGRPHNFTIYDNDQMLKAAPWNDIDRRLPERRAGAHPRHRRGGRWPGEHPDQRPGRTASRACCCSSIKQPGANVIETVQRIKAAAAARAWPSMPPSIKVDQVDRPHHHHPRLGARRRVHAAADDLPGRDGDLPVPAQRLGDAHSGRHRAAGAARHRGRRCTCSAYSLDNLSLMALTIAVGFVVDDAIVMLENIYRHIEAGLTPLRGGAQGRRRDRLHHPVDQHLADGGVHPAAADGRHRRPAVPRVRRHGDADHRGVGLRLADALADDVRAVPARRAAGAATAASTWRIERGFEWLLERLHARPGLRAAPPARHAGHVPRSRWRRRCCCTS